MKNLLLAGLLLLSLKTVAQNTDQVPQDSIPSEIAKLIFKYEAAKLYNDPAVTRMALYDLLAENPNNVALRDSLALEYLQQQLYASAALVSQEVVSLVPNDMFAAEIAAISFERLGVKNKALKYYEKLYLNNTDDIDKLYKMAFMQKDLQLFEESMSSASQLSNHKLAKETTLVFPTDDGKGQEVSMSLAAKRLKALIQEAKGNKAEAVKHLKEVLTEKPDFEMAKKHLAELQKN